MRKSAQAMMLIAATAAAGCTQPSEDAAMQQGGADESASAAAITALYQGVRGNIIASAEQMAEENYAFRPTPEVRSFGELLGHVANASFSFCGPPLGEDPPSHPNFEEVSSKAEIVQGLRDGFAFCDRAYALSGTQMSEPLQFFGQDHTRLSVLAFNLAHDNEHYGNIVTYLRLNGMVPPSSQGGE